MTWNERIGQDWEAEPDAETTEEMLEIASREALEEESRRQRDSKLWETFAGYVAADGTLTTKPKLT